MAARSATDDRTLRAGSHVGGTKLQSVVVDPVGTVLGSDRRPTPRTGGPADVAAAIVASVTAATKAAGAQLGDVVSVGVGSPGQIDRAAGTVANAPNLPDWMGSYPLGPDLAKHVGCRVLLGNDVHVAAVAEATLGAGRGFGSFLAVWVGAGIGGAVVRDGELWLGRGAAGELGHMVVAMGGRQCTCGRLGCVEAYVGRQSMERIAREWVARGRTTALFDLMEFRGDDRLTSSVWTRSLASGDAVTRELLATAEEALGAGVASAVNLLDVDGVVVGGGLGTTLGEPFLEAVRTAAAEHLLRPDDAPDYRVAGLGDLGGAIGAAMLAGG